MVMYMQRFRSDNPSSGIDGSEEPLYDRDEVALCSSRPWQFGLQLTVQDAPWYLHNSEHAPHYIESMLLKEI